MRYILKIVTISVAILGAISAQGIIKRPLSVARAADNVQRPAIDNQQRFTTEEMGSLASAIQHDQDDARWYATFFRYNDASFKWGLLIASALVTIFAALAKVDAFKNQTWVGVSLIILGTLSTLMSAASQQFNFPKAKTVYDAKVVALQTLLDDVTYKNPPRDEFLKRLNKVRAWSSETKVEDVHLPDDNYVTQANLPLQPAHGADG